MQRWKPWQKSSGPKTAEGKAVSKLNGLKHGAYSAEVQELRKVLREQAELLEFD